MTRETRSIVTMLFENIRLFYFMKDEDEMKTSIAPNSSEGRAQRRNPSLSNSKEESREISMVVIREPGRRGARAEKPDRRNAF